MYNENGKIGIVFPSELEKSAGKVTELYSLQKYEDIFSIDNLYKSYISARKGKRNRKVVYEFEKNVWEELQKLHDSLKDGTYKPSVYRTFKIYEPKERLVVAPHFKDSVVQHALYNAVYPIFDRSFIFDSYGCRKGKGAHSASKQLQTYMREHTGDEYYLQIDIQKYYYSINHEILRDRISRKIDNKKVVNLLMLFVDETNDVGLHIGNLLSQLFGLIYLDRLDHYIKRVLKVKHYIRYVDDSILVGLSYEQAKEYLEKIKLFIDEELHLELSKFRIAKIKKGSNFVGFRTWKSKKYIRKRSLYHFSKALRQGKTASLISIMGNASHSSSIGYMQSKIKEHNVLQV